MAEPDSVQGPPVTPIDIPGVGKVVLVNREKMKRKVNRRMFARLSHIQAAEVPPPPAACDWSKGESIKFPVLGNDQEGDCYYAAILHMVQVFCGQYGAAPQFNVQQVLQRYEQLSGGDNGLSDSDVYPEWKSGLLGPNGPHKIRDSLIVDILNPETLKLAIWGMGSCLYTCSLPSGWANNATPGAVWSTGAGGSVGGHAIILTGYKTNGYFDLRTWGISPPIQVTLPGMMENDPEIIVVFSEEMFHPTTRLSPAGFTWEQTRQIWIQHGGADVGPAPWVDPVGTLSLTASPASGTVPLTVTFTGAGDVMGAMIDFGDGSAPESYVHADGAVNTHTYTTAGTYTAALTNAKGEKATAVISAGVTPPIPPAPVIQGVNTSGVVPGGQFPCYVRGPFGGTLSGYVQIPDRPITMTGATTGLPPEQHFHGEKGAIDWAALLREAIADAPAIIALIRALTGK